VFQVDGWRHNIWWQRLRSWLLRLSNKLLRVDDKISNYSKKINLSLLKVLHLRLRKTSELSSNDFLDG